MKAISNTIQVCNWFRHNKFLEQPWSGCYNLSEINRHAFLTLIDDSGERFAPLSSKDGVCPCDFKDNPEGFCQGSTIQQGFCQGSIIQHETH
jgi:hypothetical protein